MNLPTSSSKNESLKLKIMDWLKRYWASFSYVGLLLAVLFFSASLSPSLVPRSYTVQGALSGVSLAVGYGLGILLVWLWRYLELPEPINKYKQMFQWGLALGAALVACLFLWRASIWQNSIRELMEMEPVTSAHPWRVGAIAVSLALILVTGARVLAWKCRLIARKLNTIVPRRVSYVLSFIVAALLLVSITNGILIKNALRLADEAFEQLDALVAGKPAS